MTALKSSWWVGATALCLSVASCNVYKPFGSASTVEELLEEAQACLHSNDYACAIAAYNRLPDGTTKTQKLCAVQIAQAGLGVTELANTVIGNTGDGVIVELANQLVPFTQEKLTAAETAVTVCASLSAADGTGGLLRVLSLMTDCSIRIARADQLVAVDDSTTSECNATTPGNDNGIISALDIGGDGAGALSSSNPGMCAYDIDRCTTDLSAANALGADLGTAGLSAIADNISALPPELLNDATAAAVGRVRLKETF